MLVHVTGQPNARLVNVVKSYGETLALDHVNLDLHSGEVLGLIGPNGSGKTTLTNILCGSLKPDSGEIWVDGRQVCFESPADAIRVGIRSLPQHLEIYPAMSVLENIFIGQEISRGCPFFHMMDWAKMEHISRSLLERVDASQIDPRSTVAKLSGGQQKAVVLARLLATPSKVLVFDEPAAALGVRQRLRLLDILKAEACAGRSIVFISHDIEDVLAICTRVVILRRGRAVTDLDRANTNRESLSSYMALA